MLKPRNSQSRGCTHSPNKPKKFKQTFARKLMATVLWDRKGGIHATRDHNNVRGVLRNTKKLHRAIQNKRHGMLTYSVVLLHDSTCLHTAACTQPLLQHFSREFFDHPSYSPNLAPINYHLFTYLKNWLRSQHFNNNEGLMEGVKTWQSSQPADFFDTGIQQLTR
jgi:hypothetical protein